MKRIRKIVRSILTVLLFTALLSVKALAAEKIDLDKDVSLTLHFQDSDVPLTGAVFDIYLVANINECGTFTATEEFKEILLNSPGKDHEDWKNLADMLEEYILQNNIAPGHMCATDKQVMEPGMYLVGSIRHSQYNKIYTTDPFLVLLPSLEPKTNEWLYEVEANIKYSVQPLPSEPDGTTEEEDIKLWENEETKTYDATMAFTWQYWWPVVVFVITCVLLLLTEWVYRYRKTNYSTTKKLTK